MGSVGSDVKSVVISGVGGDVGSGAVGVIRRHFPGVTVTGIDVDSENVGPYICDRFELVPRAEAPNYSDAVSQICADADVFVPTSEAEIEYFAENLPNAISGLLLPSISAVQIGLDKFATFNFLKELGIPVPWTAPLSNYQDDRGPFLVKPRRGRGSQMVVKAQSMRDIPASTLQENFVAQQLLEPATSEVTAAVYRSYQGELRVVQLRRRLVGGSTSWAEVIENKEALEQIETISQSLDLRGPINVQYIQTDLGPRIFEINPRLSSTIAMRDAMGFTDLLWWIQELTTGELQPWSPPKAGTIGVKTNSPIVISPLQRVGK